MHQTIGFLEEGAEPRTVAREALEQGQELALLGLVLRQAQPLRDLLDHDEETAIASVARDRPIRALKRARSVPKPSRELFEANLGWQEPFHQRLMGQRERGGEVGIDVGDVVGERGAPVIGAEPPIHVGGALLGEAAARIDRHQRRHDVVQHQAHVAIAALELRRAFDDPQFERLVRLLQLLPEHRVVDEALDVLSRVLQVGGVSRLEAREELRLRLVVSGDQQQLAAAAEVHAGPDEAHQPEELGEPCSRGLVRVVDHPDGFGLERHPQLGGQRAESAGGERRRVPVVATRPPRWSGREPAAPSALRAAPCAAGRRSRRG